MRTDDDDDERCDGISPVALFDEGFRRCRLRPGHQGPHEALLSAARTLRPDQADYMMYWLDRRRWAQQ